MMGCMFDDEGWHTHSFQFLQPHTHATIYRKHRHTLWLRKHSLKSITTNIDKMIIPQGVCRSAVRSYLCRLASETRGAWNRACPIFLFLTLDACCWLIRAGAGGELLRLHVETSKLADFNECAPPLWCNLGKEPVNGDGPIFQSHSIDSRLCYS